MTTNLSELRALVAYNDWANGRIFDALEQLDEEPFNRELGSSFSSLRDTVGHIVVAEWIWLRRWQGESPAAPPEWSAERDRKVLRDKLRNVELERSNFLDREAGDIPRPITYTNLKGERWMYRLSDLLVHVVNHSTYHRGQVVTMLRQVGAPAISTDYLLYLDATPP